MATSNGKPVPVSPRALLRDLRDACRRRLAESSPPDLIWATFAALTAVLSDLADEQAAPLGTPLPDTLDRMGETLAYLVERVNQLGQRRPVVSLLGRDRQQEQLDRGRLDAIEVSLGQLSARLSQLEQRIERRDRLDERVDRLEQRAAESERP